LSIRQKVNECIFFAHQTKKYGVFELSLQIFDYICKQK